MILTDSPLSGVVENPIFNAQLIVSLTIMFIILVFCIIVRIKLKKANPIEKPKGILLVAEFLVSKLDSIIDENMGPQFKKVAGPIFGFIIPYLFLSMLSGLFGVPCAVTSLWIPLSLGLTTFILIHATAVYYNRWKYFKRYVEPFAIMLPINLLSMWAPLLSLSFRLFGNAIAGYVIMKLIYWAFEQIQIGVVNLGFAAVVITPFLHAYFDVFSGFIQTMVFTLLSMAFIKNEVPLELTTNKPTKKDSSEKTKEKIEVLNTKTEAIVNK